MSDSMPAHKREPGPVSGGGCPHEARGMCQRVKGRPCDPGMKGCVLFGRFEFSNPEKHRPARRDRTGARIARKATKQE